VFTRDFSCAVQKKDVAISNMEEMKIKRISVALFTSGKYTELLT
jgi:hypothetical protein